jgi:predicted nucleotidyltransferase
MLEIILGSRSKIKLLREMVRNEEREYCLEDLVKATKQSFGTVHPALGSLTESRIVVVRKMGRSKLYRANKRHVLYEKVKDLILAERDSYLNLAKAFSEGLEKKHISNIILFGSVARGDFTERSDIDMLVIYSRTKPEDAVLDRVDVLMDEYDVTIVPTYLSVTETKDRMRKADRFILKVLEEGEVLYGDGKWLGR